MCSVTVSHMRASCVRDGWISWGRLDDVKVPGLSWWFLLGVVWWAGWCWRPAGRLTSWTQLSRRASSASVDAAWHAHLAPSDIPPTSPAQPTSSLYWRVATTLALLCQHQRWKQQKRANVNVRYWATSQMGMIRCRYRTLKQTTVCINDSANGR